MEFLTQNKAKLSKILIITLVFLKRQFFRQKLSKIAENCNHNIDPKTKCFETCLGGFLKLFLNHRKDLQKFNDFGPVTQLETFVSN
jgi:hypothetical protein